MGQFVGICVVLVAAAVGFVLLTEGREAAALLEVYRSLPLQLQAAWLVIVLVPPALVICSGWLWYTLRRQRKVAQALELRLDGVRDRVKDLAEAQPDAEAGVHRLARTDPEEAIAALQRRLDEAERVAQVQQSRNETGDLQSRVDHIRAQQQTLKERLAPVLEHRRSIEQVFLELHTRQRDIDHALDEIASADDVIALDMELKNFIDSVKRNHGRCDDIERAVKIVAELKQDHAELQARLAPLGAAEGGIVHRLDDVREARDKLASDIERLLQTPQGPLGERIQAFAEDKKVLEGRLSGMTEEFARLATLRRDLSGLFASFDRTLDVLAVGRRGDNAGGVEARTEELARFVEETQAQLGDIERQMVVFSHLKAKLADLQSRLTPLESADGGVVRLIDEVREVRDSLATKIRRMEQSEDGDLAERVRKFTETQRELEERVSALTKQFLKLAAIRTDIAGLFEKLSGAVNTSAN